MNSWTQTILTFVAGIPSTISGTLLWRSTLARRRMWDRIDALDTRLAAVEKDLLCLQITYCNLQDTYNALQAAVNQRRVSGTKSRSSRVKGDLP